MRVLVTRPEGDAREIARRLASLGHEAIVAPLLDVVMRAGPAISLDGIQALLFTSANGARALAARTTSRDLPVFAVGPQTAGAARREGFADVRNADGDATALARATAQWADAAGGALLHATGTAGESLLATALGEMGYTVRTLALYDVVGAATVPPLAAEALRAGKVDAALFFSPRSAAVFRLCIGEAALEASLAPLLAVAISRATATALDPLRFRELRIAAAPNQDALLDQLSRVP